MDRHHEWLLKRNCSMSPRQAAYAYGALSLVVFCVGCVFALVGFWLVLPFSLLEIAVVAAALLYYARHATDREHIAIEDDALTILRIDGGEVQQIRLDPCWTRITLPDQHRALIKLESRGVQVDVGMYVSSQLREQVAREMAAVLKNRSFLR